MAWNLALALRATNELVEAVRIARQLLDEHYGELQEEQREQIATLAESGPMSARETAALLSVSLRSVHNVLKDLTDSGA